MKVVLYVNVSSPSVLCLDYDFITNCRIGTTKVKVKSKFVVENQITKTNESQNVVFSRFLKHYQLVNLLINCTCKFITIV